LPHSLGYAMSTPVDVAAHYRQLLQLGRDQFLSAAAPGALVRYRSDNPDASTSGLTTVTLDRDNEEFGETLQFSKGHPPDGDLAVYPLSKKPGASFPDRITIGRTANNDVAIADTSVSRLHAYVRRDGSGWIIADAGSKNGSWLQGVALEARRERPLPSRSVLRFGDVDLTFYVAADLYGALGGT
jgi:hypothetical protein